MTLFTITETDFRYLLPPGLMPRVVRMVVTQMSLIVLEDSLFFDAIDMAGTVAVVNGSESQYSTSGILR